MSEPKDGGPARCETIHPPTGEQCFLGAGHKGNHRLDPERHRCHARNCQKPVKAEMLMCLRHWRMVPRDVQKRVWAAYRPGQCDDMRPSEGWHEAADTAIAAVFAKESALAARSGGE